MPINIDPHIKKCICCGMTTITYELFFVCSKCTASGHTGSTPCVACEKLKEDK